MASLSKTILANLQAELLLAIQSGNIKRKKYLIGQIAALKQAMESARHITDQDRVE